MDNNKRKFILTTVLSLLGVIVLLIGGTIAYFNWESTNNPLVDITVSEFADVIFKGGNDISITNMGPVLDYNDGEITEFTIKKRIEDELPLVITVKPTTLPENLKHESFKCKLLTSSNNQAYNEVIEIDFTDKEINQEYLLLETNITDNNIKYYKIIFYIDGNMYNPDTMQGQTFAATIGVKVGKDMYKDSSNANAPVLADGMIPVMHNGTTWVKADYYDATSQYAGYDYANKKWANAVMVSSATRDTYMTADIGTPVQEADILAYYVWIPRYKYQLFNVEFAEVDSQLINVQFESGIASTGNVTCSVSEIGVETCTNKANGNWYTHPAFTFGDDELEGIWVGKFETGCGTNTSDYPDNAVYETPTIKPNVSSFVRQQLSIMFETTLYFGTTAYLTSAGVNEVDAHIMKNMEWGAVAYLKQSAYGLGTTDIGINSYRVYYDNMYNFLTGCGPQRAGSTSSDSTCNAYDTDLGMSASTTGNITGVYDMSGGAFDVLMGVIQDNTTSGRSPMSGYTTSLNSGYVGKVGSSYANSGNTLPFPESKYYDLYANGTTYRDQTAYNRSHLGDATGETRSWYSDYAEFPLALYPWFKRGSNASNGQASGLFSFLTAGGDPYTLDGSRAALTVTK